MKNNKVVILHNQVGSDSSEDEIDVLKQVESVSESLLILGYIPEAVPVSLDLRRAYDALMDIKPSFVFNLVESIEGSGRFLYFASALLDQLQIPYSGSDTIALFLTTNKILTKERLRQFGIPTPDWNTVRNVLDNHHKIPIPCIVKPVWEDASVGLNSDSVFYNTQTMIDKLNENSIHLDDFFVEEFISGREFNISILASPSGPQVLPVAEIKFVDYPSDKPKIVDYRAKWESESFEYKNTVRNFEFTSEDDVLIDDLNKLTRRCWEIFNLHGYARVDFRVRENGSPEILEINANPCISPDSGFVAACTRARIQYNKMIDLIISNISL